MKPLRITGMRATTVTVPLAAPLRHAAGAPWGRFVRTIVEVYPLGDANSALDDIRHGKVHGSAVLSIGG